jgi:hypothetical protein
VADVSLVDGKLGRVAVDDRVVLGLVDDAQDLLLDPLDVGLGAANDDLVLVLLRGLAAATDADDDDLLLADQPVVMRGTKTKVSA